MLGAGGCLWGFTAGLWSLLGGSHAGLLPSGARSLHGSPVPCGKNLLKKFAWKTKKKFWYEGPSLGSYLVSRGTAVNPLTVLKCTRFQKSTELQPESPSVPISERTVSGGVGLDELTYKQSQLEFLTKSTSKKTKKKDSVRLRVLNGLLHRALGDLLCTPEVGQEVCDLNVELSKVSLTSDFSACRVYWRTTPSAEQNAETQATLQRYAAYMRHLLMSQQTVRNMPPIVFVQDKEHASLAEVDRLLAVADLEPPDKKEDLTESDLRDPETPDVPLPRDTLGPAVHSSLCGIDHEALNKQIMEYKRRKEKRHGVEIPACPGPEQVAELTRQMKRRKAARPRMDDELSPKNYLWGVVSDSDPDDGRVFREELTLHTSGSPRKQNRN